MTDPYLVALTHFPKFSARHLHMLGGAFASYESAFGASAPTLAEAGIAAPLAEEFVSARASINPDACLAQLQKENIRALPFSSPHYPSALKTIYDPPAVLFYRGTLPPPEAAHIGVVGSRLMSPYGKQVTEEITSGLARAGCVIVSGLALGIDGTAHEAALAVGGCTVAVLGSGIDEASVYPGRHRALARRIVASDGAVCAEYPPGTLANAYHFPARNRIIAGLSKAVLVVEAKEQSGALITARLAAEEGREVFAVPGPITQPTSAGTNWLIKQGAHPATSAEDILEVLAISAARAEKPKPKLFGAEAALYELLTREPQHLDALATRAKLDISEIVSTLAVMEMKGIARNVGGMHFVRSV